MDSTTWSLVVTVFVASVVEFVEAFTVVLAMGVTRGWRSALTGAAAAVVALAGFAVAAGYAITEWLPEAMLQLIIGSLLLVFGLQWLRKAVLRWAGRIPMHDEMSAYEKLRAQGESEGRKSRFGLDSFGTIISFKGVFLEGVEIVFIVITFGLNADNVPMAAVGAAAAGVLVLTAGVLVRAPLSRVPENTLKYGVGVLLATFGTYWAVEGLGYFARGHESLEWIGGDWGLPSVLLAWLLLSWLMIVALRVPKPLTTQSEELEEVVS